MPLRPITGGYLPANSTPETTESTTPTSQPDRLEPGERPNLLPDSKKWVIVESSMADTSDPDLGSETGAWAWQADDGGLYILLSRPADGESRGTLDLASLLESTANVPVEVWDSAISSGVRRRLDAITTAAEVAASNAFALFESLVEVDLETWRQLVTPINAEPLHPC